MERWRSAPLPDPRAAPGEPARRDLPLLVVGATVSALGSSLTLLAVAIHLRPLGAGWVTAAMAAELAPVIVLVPVAGALVDRVPNRQLLVGALLLQACAVGIAAVVGLTSGRAGVLVAALAALGVGAAISRPTVAALLPHASTEQLATRAYGWFAAGTQAGFLVGFAVAGVVVGATSVATALWLDALTYALMALGAAAVRTQRRPVWRPSNSRSVDLVGFGVIRRDRVLLIGAVGLSAAIMTTVVVNVAEVFFVLENIGAGPATYGLITAMWPAAGIAGGWVTGRLAGDRALLGALAGAGVLMGLGLLMAALLVSVTTLAGGWLLGGFANAAQNVTINALIRSRVADAVRGRVFAATSGLFQAASLVGLAAGGVVVATLGAQGSLVGAGFLTIAAGAVTWTVARPVLSSQNA